MMCFLILGRWLIHAGKLKSRFLSPLSLCQHVFDPLGICGSGSEFAVLVN